MTNPLAELVEAQHLLGEILNYLTEPEESLAKQANLPVQLLQKVKAFQAFAAVTEVIEHYQEARRLRKHWAPDDMAENIIRHNLRFMIDNGLSISDLVEHMELQEDQIAPIFDAQLLEDETWRDG